jgi:hypothetical protein
MKMNENTIEYIKTVKLQENGHLINGSISVPKVDGNRHYEDVKAWLEFNTPEPEFTAEEIAKQEQDTINSEARQYLASTDWYVIRNAETGEVIPAEVLTKRIEARSSVKELAE